MILCLKEIEFFFDPFTVLGNCEFEWLRLLRWSLENSKRKVRDCFWRDCFISLSPFTFRASKAVRVEWDEFPFRIHPMMQNQQFRREGGGALVDQIFSLLKLHIHKAWKESRRMMEPTKQWERNSMNIQLHFMLKLLHFCLFPLSSTASRYHPTYSWVY